MANKKHKVTISADYFAELYAKANETDNICKECREEHTAEEFNALRKERDELKEKLDDAGAHYCTSATGKLGDNCKVAKRSMENEAKLAAAEQCISDCEIALVNIKNLHAKVDADEILNIIRAYHEKVSAL